MEARMNAYCPICNGTGVETGSCPACHGQGTKSAYDEEREHPKKTERRILNDLVKALDTVRNKIKSGRLVHLGDHTSYQTDYWSPWEVEQIEKVLDEALEL
jgi:excinuclease UvrABC ATPase subunit